MYSGHIESGAGQEGSQNPNPVGVEMGSYYLNRTRVEMHHIQLDPKCHHCKTCSYGLGAGHLFNMTHCIPNQN